MTVTMLKQIWSTSSLEIFEDLKEWYMPDYVGVYNSLMEEYSK